jgi:nucleoside-diphosphate-sugar epimerase
MQATTITLRHPDMRIASLRISWSVPSRSIIGNKDRHTDLWGYVQRDSAAEACLLSITPPEELPAPHWNRGHEVFFIVSPRPTEDEAFEVLRQRRYADVRVKDPRPDGGWTGFYDCSKARKILGWVHQD